MTGTRCLFQSPEKLNPGPEQTALEQLLLVQHLRLRLWEGGDARVFLPTPFLLSERPELALAWEAV